MSSGLFLGEPHSTLPSFQRLDERMQRSQNLGLGGVQNDQKTLVPAAKLACIPLLPSFVWRDGRPLKLLPTTRVTIPGIHYANAV